MTVALKFKNKKAGGSVAKYNTVQKELLIRFLKDNSDKAMTVAEMTELMRSENSADCMPSESTVYRLIKELVTEGLVKRTVNGNSREFLYQMTDGKSCCEHLHMKCRICGKLMHMDTKLCSELIDRLDSTEGFTLDKNMVLTGVCKGCK